MKFDRIRRRRKHARFSFSPCFSQTPARARRRAAWAAWGLLRLLRRCPRRAAAAAAASTYLPACARRRRLSHRFTQLKRRRHHLKLHACRRRHSAFELKLGGIKVTRTVQKINFAPATQIILLWFLQIWRK